jgi:archaellum biogenesis ATPase FlaH
MLGGSEEVRQIHIIPSREVPPPDPDSAQGYLYLIVPTAPGLVLLSGESSAGKTVLAYNLAYHLAEGLEFCGLIPPSPLRVVYVDLESPEYVYRDQVNTIGSSDNLAFIRELSTTLDRDSGKNEFLPACRDFRPEVLFMDPLSMAWPVDDEDDNAKADRQMSIVKRMAVDLNAVIICLWNMGQGNIAEKFKARGATARIDRTDLALNYTERPTLPVS